MTTQEKTLLFKFTNAKQPPVVISKTPDGDLFVQIGQLELKVQYDNGGFWLDAKNDGKRIASMSGDFK